jgi:hypothetical protein
MRTSATSLDIDECPSTDTQRSIPVLSRRPLNDAAIAQSPADDGCALKPDLDEPGLKTSPA